MQAQLTDEEEVDEVTDPDTDEEDDDDGTEVQEDE